MKLEDIPPIPGYVSVARTAKILGMTKASVYYKIYDQDAFKRVYKLPGAEDASRPVLLLLESEVREVAEREAAARPRDPAREALAAWNKRVKDWGRTTGWSVTDIRAPGQPHLSLQAAYIAANPDDVRPE